MGAEISTSEEGGIPIRIMPKDQFLQSIEHPVTESDVQLKTCLLLAGLYTAKGVVMIEPLASSDHCERVLNAFGINVYVSDHKLTFDPAPLIATHIDMQYIYN